MLNYAIDERALADLIDLVDAVIEECTDDDYTRAMRRQRDWLVRRWSEVRASLVEARENDVRLPLPALFTESLPDDELAAANRPPEETRTGDAG